MKFFIKMLSNSAFHKQTNMLSPYTKRRKNRNYKNKAPIFILNTKEKFRFDSNPPTRFLCSHRCLISTSYPENECAQYMFLQKQRKKKQDHIMKIKKLVERMKMKSKTGVRKEVKKQTEESMGLNKVMEIKKG